MGMFDDIEYNGISYQTKDLECELQKYSIEGGRLLVQQWTYEDGKYQDVGKADVNYHGFLNFYKLHEDKRWEEYIAKFTDGNLVEVKSIPQEES